jgi:hypothetical protein
MGDGREPSKQRKELQIVKGTLAVASAEEAASAKALRQKQTGHV